MNQENFLPHGEEKPKQPGGDYLNKFDEGDTKVRVLSNAITGWVYWVKGEGDKNTPVRVKEAPESVPPEAQPNKFNKNKFIDEFWAFVVWNYKEAKIQIMDITQVTIREPIFDLYSSDDWGDPKGYDLTITKKVENDFTKYFVKPSPPSETLPEIRTAFTARPVYLEALFEGKDPFSDEVVDTSNIQLG